MESIQCPHCKKKYAVSDKVRASNGKTVGCKACGEKFEIKLQADVEKSAEAASVQSCMVCETSKGEHSRNWAGQANLEMGILFPGDASYDYLCIRCRKGIESGDVDISLNPPQSKAPASTSHCMMCKAKKIYSGINYAGLENEVRGTLFPGDPKKEYLCNDCKLKLEGGEKTASVKKKAPESQKTIELLAGNELVLLMTPVVGILLIMFWVGNMALINNPASSLQLIGLLVLIITAISVSMEVSNSDADLSQKGMYSPIGWFVLMVMLWLFAFPYYLVKRKDYGYTGRGLAGVLVAVMFLASFVTISMAIDTRVEEVRGVFSGNQVPSGKIKKALTEAMTADVRRIQLSFEVYYMDNGRYAYSLYELNDSAVPPTNLNEGVTYQVNSDGKAYRIVAALKNYPEVGAYATSDATNVVLFTPQSGTAPRDDLAAIEVDVDDSSNGYSTSCKQAAANKWLVDYTINHGNVSAEQIIEATRQVTIFTKAIRQFCGKNSINSDILAAAKLGVQPDWISNEIKALTGGL